MESNSPPKTPLTQQLEAIEIVKWLPPPRHVLISGPMRLKYDRYQHFPNPPRSIPLSQNEKPSPVVLSEAAKTLSSLPIKSQHYIDDPEAYMQYLFALLNQKRNALKVFTNEMHDL